MTERKNRDGFVPNLSMETDPASVLTEASGYFKEIESSISAKSLFS